MAAKLFVTDAELQNISNHPAGTRLLAATSRTRWINKVMHKAIKEDGVRQVLILAGGYDMRASKKNSVNQQGKKNTETYGAVKFWEVERPEVLDIKEEIFSNNNVDKNAVYVKANIATDDWISGLQQSQFDFNAPTLIIMEGNWMFLEDAEVDRVFRTIHDNFSHFTFVFDYATDSLVALERPRGMWKNAKSGINDIEAFAAKRGFVVENNRTSLQLKHDYELTDLVPGAYLATPEYASCALRRKP
jgi:methyltransferase (TIGR00027 family)